MKPYIDLDFQTERRRGSSVLVYGTDAATVSVKMGTSTVVEIGCLRLRFDSGTPWSSRKELDALRDEDEVKAVALAAAVKLMRADHLQSIMRAFDYGHQCGIRDGRNQHAADMRELLGIEDCA